MHILIVGAGFAGATSARVLAEAGHQVRVIDKRRHIGGNAYDHVDAHGVLVHAYGPHIFHTNSEKVVAFLSRFTAWRPYEHRVLAQVAGELYPLPINRSTVNRLYGLKLDEAGVAAYFERVRQPREALKTSEDVVLNSVGPDLCEKFFRGYTRKQWGLDLSELSAGVAARIPTRCNDDDRYFTDTFQAMPKHGYTAMFQRMLNHPAIEVCTGVDFEAVRHDSEWQADRIVYSGPVDEYFGYCLGKLPYRSLRFEHAHWAGVPQVQDVGTVNFPNDHAYTRTTEFKHLTGQVHPGTSTVREYPCAEGDPYYPIPSADNEALYKRYQALSEAEERDRGTVFIGRLAQYRYYNMDQVVAAALHQCEQLLRQPQPQSQPDAAPAPDATEALPA